MPDTTGFATAAVISPVGELSYKDERLIVNNGQTGTLTQRLYDAITGIQYARTEDAHGWMTVVESSAAPVASAT